MTFSLKKKKKLLIYFLLNSLCTLTKEENQLSGEAELCESEDSPHLAAASHLPVTIPLPSALTCPHQRPRCHVCSLPKAPDEIFFFWAPHFSLLNQVQGDKCHRDWWAGLSQWGHPFLEGEKSHLSKQFWVITQRAGPSAHSLSHSAQDSVRLADEERQADLSSSQSDSEGPTPPALTRGPRWRTRTNREGRGRARHLWLPQAGPLPTWYSAKTELAFLWERKWLPWGAVAFILHLWDDKATAPVCSYRDAFVPRPGASHSCLGTDGGAERKEMELRPAAAARGGIMPQWSTA